MTVNLQDFDKLDRKLKYTLHTLKLGFRFCKGRMRNKRDFRDEINNEHYLKKTKIQV